MNDTTGIRVAIAMDDDFVPGPRTAAAIAELAAALDDEHTDNDDVTGFATPTIPRTFTFGFSSQAGGSPNILFDPNPPTSRFGSTASGSPNI